MCVCVCVCVAMRYSCVSDDDCLSVRKPDAPKPRTGAESPETIEEWDDKYNQIIAVSVNTAVSTLLQYIIE